MVTLTHFKIRVENQDILYLKTLFLYLFLFIITKLTFHSYNN